MHVYPSGAHLIRRFVLSKQGSENPSYFPIRKCKILQRKKEEVSNKILCE